jgi:hypothetical protein
MCRHGRGKKVVWNLGGKTGTEEAAWSMETCMCKNKTKM